VAQVAPQLNMQQVVLELVMHLKEEVAEAVVVT
jgi:hypothetical protein